MAGLDPDPKDSDSRTPQPPDEVGWDRRRRTSEELRGYLRLFAIALAIVVAVLLTVVLDALATVLQPLAIAIFVGYLIYPGVRFFVRRHVPKPLAYTVAVVIIFFAFYLVGELVSSNFDRFLENLSSYQENLRRIEATVNHVAHELRLLLPEEQFRVDDILSNLPEGYLANALGGGTTFFLGFVGNLAVMAFFLVFLLLEVERLPERIELAYGPERARELLEVMRDINASVQRYIVLKVVMSAITGVLASCVMLAFGLDFWSLLGVFVFLFNFVPYVGSILATLAPMALALLQFDSAFTALWMGLSLTAVQLSIGNLLEPTIQGRSLNLSPLLILIALAFWGWLWGIAGMVLAVPIVVSLRIALEHIPRTRPLSILMSNVTHRDVRETRHLEKLAQRFRARDEGEDPEG